MNIKGKIFKGVKEYETIRTIEDSQKHTAKLTEDANKAVKLTILIEVSDSQIMRLNNLMQILHMQIEQGGFKTGYMEEWGVEIEDKVAPMSFRHLNEVEIVWGKAGTDISSKAKSDRVVSCSVDVIPEKDYIKNLMQNI